MIHPERLSGIVNPGIAAAISAVGVFSLTIGLSYPLFSLILEQMGLPAALIGLNAAMTPLGILVSAPVIPEVARRVRGDVLAIVSVLAVSGLLILMGSLRDPLIWLGLRFLLGVAINTLYVLSETWINLLAPPAIRGRVIGVYGMVASAGFALGPALLGILGTGGILPFAVAAVITVLPVPLLMAAGRHLPPTGGEGRGGILDFVRRAPILLIAVGAFALFDQATLSLLPIYGLAVGMDETRRPSLSPSSSPATSCCRCRSAGWRIMCAGAMSWPDWPASPASARCCCPCRWAIRWPCGPCSSSGARRAMAATPLP